MRILPHNAGYAYNNKKAPTKFSVHLVMYFKILYTTKGNREIRFLIFTLSIVATSNIEIHGHYFFILFFERCYN